MFILVWKFSKLSFFMKSILYFSFSFSFFTGDLNRFYIDGLFSFYLSVFDAYDWVFLGMAFLL